MVGLLLGTLNTFGLCVICQMLGEFAEATLLYQGHVEGAVKGCKILSSSIIHINISHSLVFMVISTEERRK